MQLAIKFAVSTFQGQVIEVIHVHFVKQAYLCCFIYTVGCSYRWWVQNKTNAQKDKIIYLFLPSVYWWIIYNNPFVWKGLHEGCLPQTDLMSAGS